MSLGTSADEDAGSADDPSASSSAPALEAALEAGEAVLTQRFGSSIRLVEPEDLAGTGPATVLRARVASPSFALPRTLVVKHYPDAPVEGPAHGEPDPFAHEAVSYQLFTALPPEDRMCPELVAHDGTRRVLVIEDLGRLATLEDALRGRDARAAEVALLSWARALGRVHASTAGREADFNALLRRLGAGGAEQDTDPSVACAQLPVLLADALGVPMPEPVRAAVERAAERLRTSSCRAFTPVQLWPDNNLVTDAGLRFLDFEKGRVRCALMDAGHLRVPFVSSPDALALPPSIADSMVAAWRAEVQAVWPVLSDDETFSASLFDAQLMLVWLYTWRLLPDLSGSGSRRRGEGAAAMHERWRQLAGHAEQADETELAAYATEVSQAIDARFGPGLELPLYPAFRS